VHLRCLSRYSTPKRTFEVGQVVELDDADAAFLQRDSPGSFEVVEVDIRIDVKTPAEAKALEKPVRNKAVTAAEVK
jgi:hypothetical protein